MNGEQLTLLPAESLASLSVWPGSREAQQMTVTSGLKLLESLPSCDRGLSWLRTLVASSAWRSTMCLLTWQHRVTPAGRSYYQLRASVPPIAEIEFGPLPTPTSQVAKHATPTEWERENRPNHLHVLAMWPTPRHEGFDAGAHRGKPDSLHSAVKMFPTPDAGMVQGGRTLPEGTSATGMTPDGKKRQVGLTNAVKMLPTPKERDFRSAKGEAGIRDESPDLNVVVAYGTGMKLNPDWVSRMMGFPDDYLTLDGETATP